MGAAGGARSGAAGVRRLLRVAAARSGDGAGAGVVRASGGEEGRSGRRGREGKWSSYSGSARLLFFPFHPFSRCLCLFSLARALARTPDRDEDERRGGHSPQTIGRLVVSLSGLLLPCLPISLHFALLCCSPRPIPFHEFRDDVEAK
jgi:hypothetical protein